MTVLGSGGGIGGVGGGRPPQRSAPTLIRLNSESLAQLLQKYLTPQGFSVSAAKDEQLRNYPKVIISKGKEKLAILSINNDLTWLNPIESGKDFKTLVESLSRIMVGKARQQLDKNIYWYDAKLDIMTQQLQPDLKALHEASKHNAAAPAIENGIKAVFADTLPHPVPIPSHERTTKPIEYLSSLIQGKGKDAKLMFTSEHLMEALKRELEGVQSISAIETKPGAQNAAVEIKVGDMTYRLSVTPLIASLSSQQGEVNLSLIKTLASIFGKFDPRPGKKHYICSINWTKVEAQLGERIKSVMGKAAEGQRAVAEKLALEKTEPGPLVETSVSPTAKTAPIKPEYEEAVKKWAHSQLVEWLKAKFHEFKLEEMTFAFSEGRVNISVKAAHQIFVKIEVDSRGVTNRVLNFSLSVGEFGTFVRQIIPDHRDLRLLQEALVSLGKSKQSYVSLHYANLDSAKFIALIGCQQEGGESK